MPKRASSGVFVVCLAYFVALSVTACRSSGSTPAPVADDFESYPTGQAPGGAWIPRTSAGAAVAIDDTQARSGSKSVKLTTPAGANTKRALIRMPVGFPAGNAFHGRMMFRLESAPAANSPAVHWTFIQAGGLVPGQEHHAVYRYGGQMPVMEGTTFVGNQLMANYETPDFYDGVGPGSDCWQHAQRVVVPVGVWTCVEWQFDGPAETMRLWLNGAAVESLTVIRTGQGCVNQPADYRWTAPTFDHLELGWESYQSDEARTLWIDDVAISTTRIPCP